MESWVHSAALIYSLFAARRQQKLRGSKTARVRWVDILGWSEFKASEKDLVELLNRQRKEYGLSILDKETLKSRQSTPQNTPPKSSPSTPPGPAFASSSTSAPGTPGKPENKSPPAGTKRPRNSLDSRDEASKDDSGSGIKRKTLDYSETHGRADAKVQSGGYALEAAACTYGTRSSCLGIVLDNDVMSLWYYDAAGYVSVNQCLSLLADFEKVVAIFVGFACLGHERWGAIPSVISPPTSAPYPTNFPPESLNDHSFVLPRRLNSKQMVRVTLTEPCFTQYNLVGRRTFLYDIKTDTVISKKPLVVKLSYQVVTRKREDQLLTRAKKAKVGHLPEFHLWGDLWNMSDGIRQIFYDTSSRLSKDEKGVATYEDRTLRALVYTKYLPLKALFSKSCELLPVMVDQILDCAYFYLVSGYTMYDIDFPPFPGLHDLRYKANILHRDVSCNNIMYDIRRGKVHFILIDYDLATVVTDEGEPSTAASSKHRTGTLPFMAHDLLVDMHDNSIDSNSPRVMHYLRHDYESLLYVSLWCVIYLPFPADDEQKEILIAYLHLWETGTIETVAGVKLSLIINNIGRLPLPPSAEYLRPFFMDWITLFGRAKAQWVLLRTGKSRENPRGAQPRNYDFETCNGILTRDTIKKRTRRGTGLPS
ncbi:hypothetical protein EW026_g6975 [Hermanssonia centrifuga]|uniref:Protein kinase domain-containing protein n=1 Tax=Hermanssonia centrifuga TaxID=98765 RepID=A0A4S4KDP9_9APHY|nr:hypothetical protein EW026_g6975 [Hermanssonia centrifuga]